MKHLKTFFVLTVILTACVTTPVGPRGHSIVGPDGTENELISCEHLEECYGFARQICAGTYKINNSNSNTYSEGSGKTLDVGTDFILLVKCDSGRASYPDNLRKVLTTSTQPYSLGNQTGKFPKANSFKDCEKYGPIDQDACREEVYKRAHH